jgi:hypothetical protein
MTPLSAIAMVGITPAEAGAASGLFNMMRNLGGTIGTAAIETFFTKREQFHSAIINPHVSLLEPATRSRLADLQQYFMSHGFPDPAGALHRAVIAVGDIIRTQATIMGYADCFALIGVVLIFTIFPVALLRRALPQSAGRTRRTKSRPVVFRRRPASPSGSTEQTHEAPARSRASSLRRPSWSGSTYNDATVRRLVCQWIASPPQSHPRYRVPGGSRLSAGVQWTDWPDRHARRRRSRARRRRSRRGAPPARNTADRSDLAMMPRALLIVSPKETVCRSSTVYR